MTPLTTPIFDKLSYDSDSVASENQSRLYFRSRDILSNREPWKPTITDKYERFTFMLTIYDRMSQSLLIWGKKNMKMEKRPTKTTKLPVILNNV